MLIMSLKALKLTEVGLHLAQWTIEMFKNFKRIKTISRFRWETKIQTEEFSSSVV